MLPGNEKKVCKLVKSLYGLKQVLKQWHEKFDIVILANGFKLNGVDKCVYSKFTVEYGVIVCLYMDDMLIFGTNMLGVCETIGCKWAFRRKYRIDGTIQTFKIRLVAKGFRQREGIDYFDTYAPVARIASICVLIALASIYKLVVHQMDVKTTFLNGVLD